MKKFIVILVFVIAIVLVASYIVLQKEKQPETLPTLECTSNSDCKLIYSSCDCEAVPINDLRVRLVSEPDVECIRNSCSAIKGQVEVTAVCKSNKCIRSYQ